jgi:glutathione synthase/RimK-type ligase-like ATP-grasp enzyme
MPRLALVTCEELPLLDPDEQFLLPALAERGVDAESVPWTAGHAALAGYDAVVVRSCWDYHLQPDAFLSWIDGLDRLGMPVWNPPHVLRWNLDKRHLLELQDAGVAVLPIQIIERGAGRTLADVLADSDWPEAVVKPVVSLGGWETWRVTQKEMGRDSVSSREKESRWAALSSSHDLIVQRFAPEILSEGEWSLVFIAGAFSHAVIKRPAAGEFRVQEEHGGEMQRVDPALDLVELAAEILAICPDPQLYSRVDGVFREGRFELMEVELIDPSLYLAECPESAKRWANRLAALVL